MFIFLNRNLLLKNSLVCFLITATLLISGGCVLFLPKKARAFPVVDIKQAVWSTIKWPFEKINTIGITLTSTIEAWNKSESIYKQIGAVAMEIALRQVMAMITNDIVDWVKTGYKGKPAFMDKNFGDFLGEAGDNAGGDFVAQYLGAGWLCQPFDADIKIALLDEKRFNEKAKCTLTDMGKNLKKFYEDFNNGGWTEWLKLTEPQNNFYGALLLAKSEKTKEEQKAKEETEKDIASGQGFLNIQDCVWYDANGREVIKQPNVTGRPPLPDACIPHPDNPQHTIGGFMAPCEKKCAVKTPGAVVNELTKKTFTSGMERINMTLANLTGNSGSFFKPYIMTIADAMIDQLIKDGLAKITERGASSRQPTASLPTGQKLPEIDNLPFYIQQEAIDVQSLLINLKSLEKNVNELYTTQQKIINLFERRNENLTSWPADFLTYINALLPIIGEVKEWQDICSFSENTRFGSFGRLDYLILLRRLITFEELGSQRIFVSQQETPGSKTTIEKTGAAYAFSSKNLFDESVFVLIDTKETTVENNGVATTTKESIPAEHYYSLIDWYVNIENIDQLETGKTGQEAIEQTKQTMNDFIAGIKAGKTQTEKIIPLVVQAKLTVEEYLAAANDYSAFFEKNATGLNFEKVNELKEAYGTDPASLDVANPLNNSSPEAVFAAYEIVLLDKGNKAIIAAQKLGQPQPFKSGTFKEISEDVQEFASATVESNGDLTMLLGDKANEDKKDLYGFIKGLKGSEMIYAKSLYHRCAPRISP